MPQNGIEVKASVSVYVFNQHLIMWPKTLTVNPEL